MAFKESASRIEVICDICKHDFINYQFGRDLEDVSAGYHIGDAHERFEHACFPCREVLLYEIRRRIGHIQGLTTKTKQISNATWYEIERGIPITPEEESWEYVLRKIPAIGAMEVGDSMKIPLSGPVDQENLHAYEERVGQYFEMRTIDGGYRIWRTK